MNRKFAVRVFVLIVLVYMLGMLFYFSFLTPGEDGLNDSAEAPGGGKRKSQTYVDTFPHAKYKPRDVKDHRNPKCPKDYGDHAKLGTASVVVIFHSENYAHVELTVKSLLYITPSDLLKEIILVDDFNESPVPENIVTLPKVKLIHNKKREGLIRSRVFGADVATGDVVVFMDAHTECNEGWLEPLLWEIYKDEKTLAVPIIDILTEDSNLTYVPVDIWRGGIQLPDWVFSWIAASPEEARGVKPINSPTHAGGYFAMSRKWWEDVGKYDMGMKVWGTENVEIAVRVWMCGGSVKMIPCSRIAHLFRKAFPYKFPDGFQEVNENKIRMAIVWFDEYAPHLLKHFPRDIALKDRPDLEERFEIRRRLKCHNFQWFLDNVYPELKEQLKSDPTPAGLIPPQHL